MVGLIFLTHILNFTKCTFGLSHITSASCQRFFTWISKHCHFLSVYFFLFLSRMNFINFKVWSSSTSGGWTAQWTPAALPPPWSMQCAGWRAWKWILKTTQSWLLHCQKVTRKMWETCQARFSSQRWEPSAAPAVPLAALHKTSAGCELLLPAHLYMSDKSDKSHHKIFKS